MSATLPAHMGQSCPGHREQAEHIGAEQVFDLLLRSLCHRAQQSIAGVVGQNIYAAETLDPLTNGRKRRLLVVNIEPYCQQVRVLAQPLGDCFRIPCGGNDRISGLQGLFGDQCAKFAGSASDKPSTYVMPPVSVRLPSLGSACYGIRRGGHGFALTAGAEARMALYRLVTILIIGLILNEVVSRAQ
nr:hypothetical protein [Microbulbifer sp. GG15]